MKILELGEINVDKDIACFSLGSTKLLSGGQGGALIMDERELYERAVLLGYFGERALKEVLNPLSIFQL